MPCRHRLRCAGAGACPLLADHSSRPDTNDCPTGASPAGDETRLLIAHANRLRRAVRHTVNTSVANLDDACAFAWAQLVACQPRRETVFSWLVTVATREAIRLDKRDRRWTDVGDHVIAEVAAEPLTEDRALLLDVVDALDTVHPRRRRMLLMHAVGFTSDEIAAEYRINPSRARGLVYKARLQLREVAGDVARADADPSGG